MHELRILGKILPALTSKVSLAYLSNHVPLWIDNPRMKILGLNLGSIRIMTSLDKRAPYYVRI